MSWQDDLRRLDDELANGRLTHETHRKLRDELLASVSGGSAASPVVSPLRRPTAQPPQQWQSTYPQPAQVPVPSAPPRPAPPVPSAPPAQQTTPLPHPPAPPQAPPPPEPAPRASAASLLSTKRQTTAPSPADHRATDSMPYPRRDTSALPTPPPLRPRYTAAPAESAREFPPDNPFPSARKDRRKPTWLFLALGVLLVLALIIAGTWWVGRSSNTVAAPPSRSATVPNGAPAPVQGTTGTPAPTASLEDRLPALPGTPSVNNSTMSLAKGAELNLYPQASVQTFTDDGATEVVCRASSDSADAYFVLAFPTKSAANAQAIVSYLGQGALSGGYAKTSDSRFTVLGDKAGRSMKGTWYVSGTVAITLWVSQPAGGDKAALADKFDRTLSALQLKLPLG